jgi:sugar phosphate isomerase/epimerase
MKIAAHTLGTPHHDLGDAIRLFARLGMDGIEVIWQDDYRSGIPEVDDGPAINAAKRTAMDVGVQIVGLTPYMTAINSLDDDERETDLRRFERCIRAAERLGAGRVRVYAGRYLVGDEPQRSVLWERLVDALKYLAPIAAQSGVTLCVENHHGTMTVSAADSVSLMQAVDAPGVGILYDQANLAFTHKESYAEAIELQHPWIRHVHVKDLVFTRDAPFVAHEVARVDEGERNIRSRVIGDGVLDWPAIIAQLEQVGYDDYLSVEYEYRWHPEDLPDPEVGFALSVERLRQTLSSRQGANL